MTTRGTRLRNDGDPGFVRPRTAEVLALPARRVLQAMGVGAILALVACGGGQPGDADANADMSRANGSASAEAVDACKLVTTDEVAQVLADHNATHPTYAVTAKTGNDGSCTYAWTVNGSGDEFTVNEFPADSYVPQPGIEPRRIADIGDEAFEDVGSFYARVGDLMVNVVNLQEGEGSDEALLRIAVARMSG